MAQIPRVRPMFISLRWMALKLRKFLPKQRLLLSAIRPPKFMSILGLPLLPLQGLSTVVRQLCSVPLLSYIVANLLLRQRVAFLSTRLLVSRTTVPVTLPLLTTRRVTVRAQSGLTAYLAPLALVQSTCLTMLLWVAPKMLLPVIQFMALLPIWMVSVQGRRTIHRNIVVFSVSV